MALATAPVNRLLLGPGDRVGRYEVIGEVAQGGMATVYIARLSSIGGFGKLVALKVLLPHLRADRQIVNMLLDEARIAASIQHPNVVQVIDIAEHDGTPYIAMELLRGRSLSRVAAARPTAGGPMPPGAVLAVLARAAEGLHAAHEAKDGVGNTLGVVHRDVSPQNIHVSYDGHVKVVDFGIAAAAGRLTETSHGQVKGKVQYLAPEQLNRSRPVDRRADVWALAVVAYELLSGRQPFKGEDVTTTMWNVLNVEVEDLGRVVPGLPRGVTRAVGAALRREPSERPASCAELMRAFDAGAAELGGGSREELAAFMERTFATERAVEDERIAAVLREEPPPPFEEKESSLSLGPGPESTPGERPRRIAAPASAVAILVAAGLAAVAASSIGGADAPLPEAVGDPEPPVAAPSAPPPLDVPPTAPEQDVESPHAVVTVEVDDRARLVLVDGARRDERPLAISVPQGGSVAVEVIDRTGGIHRHRVTAADDGMRIVLPERRSRRAARRAAAAPPTMSEPDAPAEPSREILRDVF